MALSGKILFLLLLAGFCATAQEYNVSFGSYKFRLYRGYINEVLAGVLPLTDSDTTFSFNANAVGAEINYDERGRLSVLPFAKEGRLDIYAEAKGKSYYTGSYWFDAIEAPVNSGVFIEVMGITKDDPKTRLKAVKKYIPPADVIRSGAKFELLPLPTNGLEAGLNIISIRGIYLKGDTTYINQPGEIDILSTDAKIRKLDKHTFHITPLANRRRVFYAVYLNKVKVADLESRID